MAQATNPSIATGQTGTAYRTQDNDRYAAAITQHSGSTRPSYAVAGTLWLDTSGTPWILKMYDGADDISVGTVNATTNTFNASNAASTGSTIAMTAAINEAGATVASASTTDIGAAAGNYVSVTGTTTITALGTAQTGTRRTVRFASILTLTHNGTSLILPGAANITTAAGDVAVFVSLGSGNWFCVSYLRAASIVSTLAVGTAANNIVQLDASAKLPAVDGSQLTGISSAGSPAFKNLLIGGDFTTNPWQRGTSGTGLTATAYLADRWQYSFGGPARWTIQKTADAPTPAQAGVATTHCLELICTTADATPSSIAYVGQHVEGLNAPIGYGAAGALSLTLSFWVKSNAPGTYVVVVANTAWTRSYLTTFVISGSATWEKKTITVPGDTAGSWTGQGANTEHFGVYFVPECLSASYGTANAWTTQSSKFGVSGMSNLAASISNYMRIALVQLEAGSSATSFEALPADVVLARCLRYFWNIGGAVGSNTYAFFPGWCANSTTFTAVIPTKVPMRTSPTFTATAYTNATGIMANNSGFTPSSATQQASPRPEGGIYAITTSGLTANAGGSLYVYSSDGWSFSAEL